MDESYELVLVGTGFASSFFLHRFLERRGPDTRVLVLERGDVLSHRSPEASAVEITETARASFTNQTPAKPWVFKLAFGGGSNCWWACTPRLLPEDFRMSSQYGVGADWPVTYDALEPYYCDAEEIMGVSGPSDGSPYPRSRPYPQPPHRFSDPDRLLKQRFPDLFFHQPCARPTRALPSGRPACCNSGVCHACPINSKFSVLNELQHLYEDSRVTLRTGATAVGIETSGGVARHVRYRENGAERTASADLIGLGANAVFNPHLLQRSGLDGPHVGRGLSEQRSVLVDVALDGVDNFQGSTSITGMGYMLYAGEHRRHRAGAVMESWNVPTLRDERGKWRQRLILKFIFEDLPQADNRVTFDAADPERPRVSHAGRSSYLERGIDALDGALPTILSALPYESHTTAYPRDSEAHILGTTAMGADPLTSVVDGDLRHHQVRNLLVLGGSVFPTISPSAPSLTISALSLRAADRLFTH